MQLTSAQVNAKGDGGIGLVITLVPDALGEPVLEVGALAEAQVHVLLSAVQRGVLGNDALEAVDGADGLSLSHGGQANDAGGGKADRGGGLHLA